MRKVVLASLAGVGVVASLAVAGPASADPTDLYPAPLNGVGSDTTELVMIDLDAAIPALGTWSVNGPTPYDTNGPTAYPGTADAANCAIQTRILGSSGGQIALANSITNNDGCFQYGRSSSRSTQRSTALVGGNYNANTPATNVPLVPIALGQDGLTYAFRQGSQTPRDLTIGQLRAIYACTFTGVVDGLLMSGPNVPRFPQLPTDLSGTRTDWVSLMNLPAGAEVPSDAATSPGAPLTGTCVDDGPGDSGATGAGGSEFAEHNGVTLTAPRQIQAHGIAQYIAQGRSITGDNRGFAQLGYINGNVSLQQYNDPASALTPATASGATGVTDGAWFRTVYNNVPAGRADDADIIAVFGERQGPAGTGGASANDTSVSISTAPNQDVPLPNSGTGICDLDNIVIDNGFTPVC
jgi:hypothetical protein